MSRPSPFAVSLTASQRRVLEARVRKLTAQQRQVVRARIVLAAAEGEQNTQIAVRLGVAVNTVSKKAFGVGGSQAAGAAAPLPPGGGRGGQGDRL